MGEPMELWKEFFKYNLLRLKYYRDVKQMEFLFQSIVNFSQMEQLSNAKEGKDIRMIKKVYRLSFQYLCEVFYDNDTILDLKFRTSYYMYKIFTEGEMGKWTKPDLILYLRTTEKCMKRIRKRKVEERPITLKYL
jgi:hypothetical protein